MNRKLLIIPVLIIFAVVIGLYYTNRAVTPKAATMEDVKNEAQAGGYRLINVEELTSLYNSDKPFLLVDTRQEWEFAAGHIKGAINFPMEPTAWSRWHKKSDLEKLLGADKDRLVVFY